MSFDRIGYSYVDGCDCVSIIDPMQDYRDEDIDFQWDEAFTAEPELSAKAASPKAS